MPAPNYFVSDLHLLARRSQAHRYQSAIQRAAGKARHFILGGDIFDFHWSTLGCPQRSVETAMEWLDDLVAGNPDCEFHFVFGNHDYNRRFIHAMDKYATSTANLQTHRYFLRLGDSVFLHGDIADLPHLCHEKLEGRRAKFLRDHHQSPWRHTLYDVAVQARLHRVISRLANPRQRVATRLLAYLRRIGHGPDTGTQHVYFGHTHEPLSDFSVGGVKFHNPGAPLAGVKFRVVEAEVARP
jgi:UDP-2,3-diacylglucosamine hydrolase